MRTTKCKLTFLFLLGRDEFPKEKEIKSMFNYWWTTIGTNEMTATWTCHRNSSRRWSILRVKQWKRFFSLGGSMRPSSIPLICKILSDMFWDKNESHGKFCQIFSDRKLIKITFIMQDLGLDFIIHFSPPRVEDGMRLLWLNSNSSRASSRVIKLSSHQQNRTPRSWICGS